MSQDRTKAYTQAGVDINAGNLLVERIAKMVKKTRTPGVVADIGGFGGLFKPDLTGMEAPLLVGATDGVGTKLKLAFQFNRHHTIGIDLVAMSVNDVLVQGARPLFFLDYSPPASWMWMWPSRSSPASPRAAVSQPVPFWAVKPLKCPTCTPRASMTLRVSASVLWITMKPWTALPCAWTMCSSAFPLPGRIPTATP